MSIITDELLAQYRKTDFVDDLITIDVNQRKLIVPSTERIVGVRGDDNAESKYFAIPRMATLSFDASDATIYVVWKINGSDGSILEGSSICNERSFDDNKMVFEWVVPGRACEFSGTIAFNVHLHKKTSKWHTTVAVCDILDGNVFIDHSEDLNEEQETVINEYLEGLLERLRAFDVSHLVVVNNVNEVNDRTKIFIDTENTEDYEFLTVEDRRKMGESLLPLLSGLTEAQRSVFMDIWGLV